MSKGSSLPDVASREIERLSRKDSQMGARPLSPRPLPASAQRMVMSVRLPSGETGRSHTAEKQKDSDLNQYKQSGISTDKKS